MNKKISIVIPAYNEEKTIRKFLLTIPEDLNPEVIVVDDGSTDNTYSQARYNGAKVIKNPHNMGYGAAILEGVKHAEGDIIVTIDADAQNDAKEIRNLVKPIINEEADFTIGSRTLGRVERPIPVYKRIGEIFFHLIIKICYGKKVTYSQSGFRAIKKEILKKIEPFEEKRFGFSTELLVKILKNRIEYKEVPITFLERKAGRSKINVIKDGFRILWVLFKTMAFKRK
ncbi:MAG: glycosyltransferase [Candidatus Lokiarchaeota archaeon]|nr:glycosyltransferase [Candidatus Lokiarchaeota archaeon]